jgi:cobalt-zinc-cadmium resistance protein CzcA
MLNRLISFSLDHRGATLAALAGFLGVSLFVAAQIPIDAFPDLTNNQVVIVTECPGMPPTEVEQLVTYPIESAVMGLPKTEGVRSISKLGLSMVTSVLDDSVPTYFARQVVMNGCRRFAPACRKAWIPRWAPSRRLSAKSFNTRSKVKARA